MPLLVEKHIGFSALNSDRHASVTHEVPDPTTKAAEARAAFRRDPNDPKRLADEARWEEEKKRAAEWAAQNYSHNNRLNEAFLRSLHRLPPQRVSERRVEYPPIGAYIVAERRAQEAVIKRQERRRKLVAPVVTLFERWRRQPSPART